MRLYILLFLIFIVTYSCQEKSDLEVAFEDGYNANVTINDSISWEYNITKYRYLGGDTLHNLAFYYYGENSEILRESITFYQLPITMDTIDLHSIPLGITSSDTDKPFARLAKRKADVITGFYSLIDHPDVNNFIKLTNLPQNKGDISGKFEVIFKRDEGSVLDTIKITNGSFKAEYLEL